MIVLILATLLAAAQDVDYKQHVIKLKVGGELIFEAPRNWGKRPELQHGEAVTRALFIPAGTPREPIFEVSVTAAVPDEPPTKETVRKVTAAIREQLQDTAIEAEITINERTDSKNMINYFTITDKDIKPREYQYLTTAVVSDGKAIVTCNFLSNDGAPDYAADAMHLLDTLTYIPKKKKERK